MSCYGGNLVCVGTVTGSDWFYGTTADAPEFDEFEGSSKAILKYALAEIKALKAEVAALKARK
jgi:hypothetical protein